MLRRMLLPCLCVLALAAAVRGEEIPISRYGTVEIAPTKTSVYIATVSMTMPRFARKGTVYSSTYVAKVFPYFFYNENGKLFIEVTDETLRKLEHGETIQFTGRIISSDGDERRLEGRAVPENATSGKIKVRVFVSKKIELIFNTTYRFPPVKVP